MSKKLNFNVTLTFSEKITDDESLMDIAKGIARAIKREVEDGDGITTDYMDAYTESISVKPQFLDEQIDLDINFEDI